MVRLGDVGREKGMGFFEEYKVSVSLADGDPERQPVLSPPEGNLGKAKMTGLGNGSSQQTKIVICFGATGRQPSPHGYSSLMVTKAPCRRFELQLTAQLFVLSQLL